MICVWGMRRVQTYVRECHFTTSGWLHDDGGSLAGLNHVFIFPLIPDTPPMHPIRPRCTPDTPPTHPRYIPDTPPIHPTPDSWIAPFVGMRGGLEWGGVWNEVGYADSLPRPARSRRSQARSRRSQARCRSASPILPCGAHIGICIKIHKQYIYIYICFCCINKKINHYIYMYK